MTETFSTLSQFLAEHWIRKWH